MPNLGKTHGIIFHSPVQNGAIPSSPQRAIALHLSLLGKGRRWKCLAPREHGEGGEAGEPWEDRAVSEE